LLTGLRAKGYDPLQAAVLGVYLHGLAGDLAAEIHGEEAITSGDLIWNLGAAFQHLQNFGNTRNYHNA
jgi:NAD(P)H-hydrate epimerase